MVDYEEIYVRGETTNKISFVYPTILLNDVVSTNLVTGRLC